MSDNNDNYKSIASEITHAAKSLNHFYSEVSRDIANIYKDLTSNLTNVYESFYSSDMLNSYKALRTFSKIILQAKNEIIDAVKPAYEISKIIDNITFDSSISSILNASIKDSSKVITSFYNAIVNDISEKGYHPYEMINAFTTSSTLAIAINDFNIPKSSSSSNDKEQEIADRIVVNNALSEISSLPENISTYQRLKKVADILSAKINALQSDKYVNAIIFILSIVSILITILGNSESQSITTNIETVNNYYDDNNVNYIITGEPFYELMVTTAPVNLRARNSIKSTVKKTLQAGKEVIILKKGYKWYEIKYDEDGMKEPIYGFIHKDYLEKY